MKKFGLIALALVTMLGIMGIGYAAWNHDITVGATVNTGYAKAIFVNSLITEPAYNNPSNNMCIATAEPSADPSILAVTVYNAFPGAVVQVLPYYVQNDGTVPIVFNSINLVDGDVDITGSTFPTDTVIAPGAESSGNLYFQLSSDPVKIPENSVVYFHAAINYGVVVGP